MSHVEPLWLRGEKESKQGEARVQRVEHEEARQFVVLPFYENGDVEPGEERYMLWGRALSDGILYPIPPHWYTMCLCFHSTYPPEGPPCYRWVVHTAPEASGHAGQGRLDLNVMSAFINDKYCTAQLRVHAEDEIFTPEPVQRSRGTAERPATVFYPDAGLWSNLPRIPAEISGPTTFALDPYSLESTGTASPGVCGPVEVFWDGVQVIRIRAASTSNWNRRDAPHDYESEEDAKASSSSGGDL
jgi:hypothetical protein